MKKKRPFLPLIVSGCALLLLVCACLALTLPGYAPQDGQSPEDAPGPRIIEGDISGLRLLEVDFGGERLSFSPKIYPGGEMSVALEPSREGWQYLDVKLSGVCRAVCALDAVQSIEKELPEFGFSKPEARVTAEFQGGRQEILIGGESQLPDGYYVKRVSDGAVFIAPRDACEKLLQSERDYRSLSFLPYYQDASASVKRLTLSLSGGEGLDISRRDDGAFELLSPFKAELDRYALSVNLLTPATRIAVRQIVEDCSGVPDGYGFETAATLEIQDEEGSAVTFIIGAVSGDKRYIMVAGVPAVLAADARDFGFLEAKPEDLMPGAYVEAPDADEESWFD